MSVGPRGERLIAIAQKILEHEEAILELRREFNRIVEEIPTKRPRMSASIQAFRPVRSHAPPKPGTMKQSIEDFFHERRGHDILAGDVVRAFPFMKTESIHTTLAKMADAGVLVRVAWGVYRLPLPDGAVPTSGGGADAAEVLLPERADAGTVPRARERPR